MNYSALKGDMTNTEYTVLSLDTILFITSIQIFVKKCHNDYTNKWRESLFL